jgi:hypothetical protein
MEAILSSEASIIKETHRVKFRQMAFFLVIAVKTSNLTQERSFSIWVSLFRSSESSTASKLQPFLIGSAPVWGGIDVKKITSLPKGCQESFASSGNGSLQEHSFKQENIDWHSCSANFMCVFVNLRRADNVDKFAGVPFPFKLARQDFEKSSCACDHVTQIQWQPVCICPLMKSTNC